MIVDLSQFQQKRVHLIEQTGTRIIHAHTSARHR